MKVNIDDLGDHICGTPVGAVLDSVDIENCNDFFEFYVHDFVRSVHICTHTIPEHNDMEYQVPLLHYYTCN